LNIKETFRKIKQSRAFRIVLRTLLFLFVLSIVWVIAYRWVPIPYTLLMSERSMEARSEGKGLDIKKEWKPINEISDYLVLAAICAEDANFEEHNGFDFESIEKAIQQNKKLKKKGKPIKGASTISQQVAKNAFLWSDRSWLRKGLEVYFTILIEIFWSKERIMEVYLNIIEMGDGIFGAEAASLTYFHKNAADLTPGEAAILAAILPNPRKWTPKTTDAQIIKKKNRILYRMHKWGGSIDLTD